MFLIGVCVGLALAVTAASGLLGMAVWVASTEKDRYVQENYILDSP